MLKSLPPQEDPRLDTRFIILNTLISIAALSLLCWLLIFNERLLNIHFDLSFVPGVNALLNSTSAICLTVGWWAIRKKNTILHRRMMLSAFVCSALFLCGYLAYHSIHGDTPYTQEGWIRVVYFFILATHILLSITVVPLSLTAFYTAWTGRYRLHRAINRIFLPTWLYVSVTGVLIYFFLHVW